MKSKESCPERDSWDESDLLSDIPPERDTWTAGEVSTQLKVSRLTVVEAMRACGVKYVCRHNQVPAMDFNGAKVVMRYLRHRKQVS